MGGLKIEKIEEWNRGGTSENKEWNRHPFPKQRTSSKDVSQEEASRASLADSRCLGQVYSM